VKSVAELLEEAACASATDSLERAPGISIHDKDEIEKRAAEARRRAPPIAGEELKRALVK